MSLYITSFTWHFWCPPFEEVTFNLNSTFNMHPNTAAYQNHFPPRLLVMARRARESWMRTTRATTRLLNGAGSLLTPAASLEEPHCFVVNKISRNLTLPLGSVALAGARTLRAIGAHSCERLQGIPKRLDKPLIRIEERPTKTRSCGNDLSSFTGELGLSSPLSYPPGSFSTEPSKSHIATAAALRGYSSG